jgi:hypothetical protein
MKNSLYSKSIQNSRSEAQKCSDLKTDELAAETIQYDE